MFEVKTYREDYENEGELLEDFPTAYAITEIMFDPVTGMTTYEFKVDEPRHAPTVREKNRYRKPPAR